MTLTTAARSRWTMGCQCLVALKLLILIVFAFNTRLVMDEFWHLHQTFYLFNGLFDDIWPEKAVLYTPYLKLSALVSWDAASQILAARGLVAGLAIALVGVVYATSRAAGQSRLAALAVLLVLLGFSNFIERSFRLQSEPQAILLAAAALWVVIRGPVDRLPVLLLAGILSGLAFVTTQKSVYFNVALGAGLVLDALAQWSVKDAVRRSVALIAGWAVAVLAYAIAFGGWDAPALLRWTFIGPLEVATTAQNDYENLRYFVVQTLRRNVLLYIACFAGLISTLSRYRALSPGARIHVTFTLVMTLLVFAHNQPWPYVFNMALPFLAFYAVSFFMTRGTTPARRTGLVILFAIALTIGLARNVQYLAHDNRQQLAVVRAAEAEVPVGSSYFDGIGMLPNRAMLPYLWLDAMGVRKTLAAAESSPMMLGLRQRPPSVIIDSYRTSALKALLHPFLERSYVPVDHNLRVPGAMLIQGPPQAFSVLSATVFVARDAQGTLIDRITVDGQTRTLPTRIEAGEHRLQLDQPGPAWLVPEQLDPGLLVPDPRPADIFDGIYD
ncbi:MAG: hypothetical protein NTW20_18165 [Rhodobacterales bacterium]|nr:hypothetical protein [Rhodobacterales bacterium]